MKKQLFLTLFLPILFAFAACSDSGGEIENGEVTLAAPTVTETTGTSLTVASSVISGANQVIKKGFCYSVNTKSPTIKDNVVDADNNFSATISGLISNTSYHIRAYVYSDSRYFYSDPLTATTESLGLNEQLENYVAPSYPDDYTSIAAWSQRGQWNLANVHDPTVMKADDGYFYMYQTDASYGNAHAGHGHFHGRRSKDLVNWEYLGATMPEAAPSWVKEKLNAIRAEQGLAPIENPGYGFWAPVARRVAPGCYRMYYCVIIDNYIKTGAANTGNNFDNSWTERAFIGMMETTDPASNNWEDKGFVICSSSDKGMNDWARPSTNNWEGYFKWNAIDPSYIITQAGAHWLIYGSWHSGIAALQVDPETGKPLEALTAPWSIAEKSPYGQLIYSRGRYRWQGSEAPEIVYNAETGYYYLFLAYDALGTPYNTRVARAKEITGPYYGIDGADITLSENVLPVVTHPYKFTSGYGWVGIAHCAIFDDGAGNWYYASQGRLPEGIAGINVSNAVMMGHVRSIRWTSDGWPVVMPERYGAVPTVKITENEIVGTWEHIDLSYSYGKQKTATTMTFSADHTITSGTWKDAVWSFDEANQVLTANGVKLYLQRETDWEASPRTHTIVYAGYTTTKTYWGKKR